MANVPPVCGRWDSNFVVESGTGLVPDGLFEPNRRGGIDDAGAVAATSRIERPARYIGSTGAIFLLALCGYPIATDPGHCARALCARRDVTCGDAALAGPARSHPAARLCGAFPRATI